MKIAIFGKNFSETFNSAIYKLFEKLNKNNVKIIIYKPFYEYIEKTLFFKPKINNFFSNYNDLPENIDLIFSIGGDGTFLECVSLIRKKDIPIVGINSGRLGFLANISKDTIENAIEQIIQKKYTIEKRTLLQIISKNNLFNNFNYGLNDFTIQKKDSNTMINIDIYIDDEFLNKYWADGLIISTPTGSTAYSLSVGGPIIVPGSKNFVINPIAPHNLTVRPIVVPDDKTIKLKVSGRNKSYLAALDYKSETVQNGCELVIKKADFYVKMLKLNNTNFFSILRNKLLWGLDKRN